MGGHQGVRVPFFESHLPVGFCVGQNNIAMCSLYITYGIGEISYAFLLVLRLSIHFTCDIQDRHGCIALVRPWCPVSHPEFPVSIFPDLDPSALHPRAHTDPVSSVFYGDRLCPGVPTTTQLE